MTTDTETLEKYHNYQKRINGLSKLVKSMERELVMGEAPMFLAHNVWEHIMTTPDRSKAYRQELKKKCKEQTEALCIFGHLTGTTGSDGMDLAIERFGINDEDVSQIIGDFDLYFRDEGIAILDTNHPVVHYNKALTWLKSYVERYIGVINEAREKGISVKESIKNSDPKTWIPFPLHS